jgi:cobalamin-dependent methionine synthase I
MRRGPDLRPAARGLRSADALYRAVPDEGATAAASSSTGFENLSIEEKLKKHIIDGEKRNLTAHLDEGDDDV